MRTLFINFDPVAGLTIGPMRSPAGYANSDITGLIDDMVVQCAGNAPLNGALESLANGAAGTGIAAQAVAAHLVDHLQQWQRESDAESEYLNDQNS